MWQHALNLPASVVITGCYSVPVRREALQAGCEFRSFCDPWRAKDKFERHPASHYFDGPWSHPEWLGTAA